MSIKRVTEAELAWVNRQYEQIGFMPSKLQNEIIAIVMSQGHYAGVGRLVMLNAHEAEMGGIYILDAFRGQSLAQELVSYLVEESKRQNLKTVYCIPFEELQHFYEKFGFHAFDAPASNANPRILEKYHWCLKTYDKNVLLLKLTHDG
ncbi:N-acetylglutamate synthase-like GNAT family acetyltransferase [Paenibacillus sp. LBL]|uniref:GNAT family N-acetyltransferase n=1 Tax=Paenibacillus sp. LBL TaxID=2940563 RepID=UPI0024772B8F|nr:GNAT family N-acetyltransferase [Paenibacillus sp. LBL]MDH6675429.1 N-acetylglutamate synthase-like GNAT family acetyltransferase [Paenibacillus sp. LBL]